MFSLEEKKKKLSGVYSGRPGSSESKSWLVFALTQALDWSAGRTGF